MEITGKAVRIYETGGPEVLKYEDVSFNKPKNKYNNHNILYWNQ